MTALPYRYRGYRYDVETGLYYLQSRYYDPNIGRFLNADSTIDTKTGILSHNSFVYYNNAPINMTDDSGHCPFWNGFKDFFVGQWNILRNPVGSYVSYMTDPWNYCPPIKIFKESVTEVAGMWKDVFEGDIDSLSYGFGQRTAMVTESLAIAGISKGVKSATKAKSNPGNPFKSGQKVGDCQIGVDPNTLKLNTNILPSKYNAALAKCKNGIYGSIQVWSDGTVYNGNHRVAIARRYGWAVDIEVRLK
ncbi:MAG: RHS repeat-associated core domain-containing protein [Saccharofermentanales bacterium]